MTTPLDLSHRQRCRAEIEAAAYPVFQQTCVAEATSLGSSALEDSYRQRLAHYEALQTEQYPGEKAQWTTFYRNMLASREQSSARARASASRVCEASARSQASLLAAGLPTSVSPRGRATGPSSPTTSPPLTISPTNPAGGYNGQGCPKNQYVTGHTRRDGTYVEGYYRNSPSDGCGGG